MCIKIMYSITTLKNVFQYQMTEFNNAKPQLLCTNLILIYVLMLECYYMEILCNILTSSLIVGYNFSYFKMLT